MSYEALAGLFGGLQRGFGNVLDFRRQKMADDIATQNQQLQQRQFEESQRRNQFSELVTKLNLVAPDADVDPELAKEAATLGLGGYFTRTEAGGIRKAPTLSDRIDQLRLESEEIERNTNKLQFGIQQRLANPNLAAEMAGMPRFEREFQAAQMGFKAPPTDADREADAVRELEHSSSLASSQARAWATVEAARIRAADDAGGLSTNQAYLRAIQLAIRTTPVDPTTKRPDPAMFQAEIARHVQSLTGGAQGVPQLQGTPPAAPETGIWPGLKKMFGIGQAGAATPPGTKTFTWDQVMDIAAREGKSPEEVAQYFTSQGARVAR